MEQLDYSNLELSFSQEFALRAMNLFHSEGWYSQSTLTVLRKYGFIRSTLRRTITGNRYYRVTESGKMYFRIKRKERIRFLIPVVISIIALLASYDVLYIKWLAEALQGAASLMKTIAESMDAFVRSVI